MELKEAYEILKRYNPIVKPLPVGSPFWKKVILEILDNDNVKNDVLMSAILVGGTIEDDLVAEKMYKLFKTTGSDLYRKMIVEAWNGNLSEKVLDINFELIGVREKPLDRYVRQIASQNIVNAFKKLSQIRPVASRMILMRLKNRSLNDPNTFTRMNAVIIIRSCGDKSALPELEKRLEIEKKLIADGSDDIGIPYVIRELEKTISFFKERT